MYAFKFADIGEGIHEGKILKWFFKLGDKVKEGETLVMISDDRQIVLQKSEKFIKKLSQGEKTMIMSEHSLKKDWDNKYDERWDKY